MGAFFENRQGNYKFSWLRTKTRQGISLSWQLASTTKVRLYFLVVQIWPPRKLLAVKGNSVQFSCSELSSLHVISLLSNITSAS